MSSSEKSLKQRRVTFQDVESAELDSLEEPPKHRPQQQMMASRLSFLGLILVICMVLYHANFDERVLSYMEHKRNHAPVAMLNHRSAAVVPGQWHERTRRDEKSRESDKSAIADQWGRKQSNPELSKPKGRTDLFGKVDPKEVKKSVARRGKQHEKKKIENSEEAPPPPPPQEDNKERKQNKQNRVKGPQPNAKALQGKVAGAESQKQAKKTKAGRKGVKEAPLAQTKSKRGEEGKAGNQKKQKKVADTPPRLQRLKVKTNNTDKREDNQHVEPKQRLVSQGDLEEKCTPWEISLDDWWQDHPTWEASFENDTHACFHPIQNPDRVRLLKKVHALQFHGCAKKPAIRPLFQMGFAATLLFHLNSGFWSAFRENRQFLPGIAHEGFRWLYDPKDQTSWAHCPTADHECLFLPISNCPRPVVGWKDEKPKKKYQWRELENNQTLVEHNIWLSHYLMRPRQVFRKKLYDFMRDSKLQVKTPCTWIHVRRADAMTEAKYKRNYYPLKEYLTRGQVNTGENILLLTDDRTTIEEANLLHPEYKWTYWDRQRHRGPVSYNAHIPSGDQANEVLTIMAERKLASQCQKGVFGNSNMAKLFRNAMVIEQPGGLANLTLVEIDRRALKGKRVEPEDFVKELDKKLEDARKKLKQQPKRPER